MNFSKSKTEIVADYISKIAEEVDDRSTFKNKLVVRLDVDTSTGGSAGEVMRLLEEFFALRKAEEGSNEAVLSVLKCSGIRMKVVGESHLFLFVEFIDDLHIIFSDLFKLLAEENVVVDEKEESSYVKFAVRFGKHNEEQQQQQLKGGSSFLLSNDLSAEVEAKTASTHSQILFGMLAFWDADIMKLAVKKMRSLSIKAKFASFDEIYKKRPAFLDWLPILSHSKPYTPQMIQKL